MNTARLRHPLHRQLKLLPWYVNCTLEPKEARKMAAHVAECHICQREVDSLVRIFSARARTMPKRPVSEARLDDLFSRIDRYEGEKRREAQAERSSERPSLRQKLSTGIMDWLGVRPALLGGAVAAVVLGIVAVPLLRAPATDDSYKVLTSEQAPAEELRVRLRFQGAQSEADVKRLVQSGVAQQKLAGPYRVERRENGEYVVIFQKKPGLAALSQLLEVWRNAPGVTDVAIDGG